MVVVIVVVVGSILHDWGFSWSLFFFILCARGLLGGAGYLRSFLGEGCLFLFFFEGGTFAAF